MREFLLTRENKINWQIILPISTASAVMYLATNLEFVTRQLGGSQDSYIIVTFVHLLISFFTPAVWALSLTLFSPGSKSKDFLIPALFILGLKGLYMIYNILTGQRFGDGGMAALNIAQLFLVPLILVGYCEWQYPNAKNKVLLYFTAVFLSAMGSTILFIIERNAYPDIPENAIRIFIHIVLEYYMALLIFRLYKVELPVKSDYLTEEKTRLNIFLENEVENEESTSKTLSKAHQEFASLTFNEIAVTYTKTTKKENKQHYNTANMVIIAINVLSLLYALSLSGHTRFRLRFDEYFSVDDLGWSLLYIAIFGFAILKLKIAADMAVFKAYTYKAMTLIGSISLLIGLYELFLGNNPAISIFSVVVNIIMIAYTIDISKRLYPHYRFISATYDPRDFAASDSPDNNN